MKFKIGHLFLYLMLSCGLLYGQHENTSNNVVITAIYTSKNSICIDGKFNEKIWQETDIAANFTQTEPYDGEPATERTEVRVVYDDNALYIGVTAYDSQPDNIIGNLTRRDIDSPSDWIYIGIDSYNDKRTGFNFGVNPAGVKQDVLIYDDSQFDTNWDAVWDVKCQRDNLGWSAEFKIPFSQLRFSTQAEQCWGFQVYRIINRLNEHDFWAAQPKNEAGFCSRWGLLTGIQNIPNIRRLQLLPYIVGAGNFLPEESGNPFRDAFDFDGNIGCDLKYALSSNMTLDMTINPDFGQIEADPSEFNLTAYETYFEEKRPFFMEGSNIFQYHIGIDDDENQQESLFYSRRIGRLPQYEPDLPDDNGFADIPQNTTIIGAAKITGKTSTGWSVGVLNALTSQERGKISINGEISETIVEPWTNYLLARTKKDFRQGRTTLGGIFTNVYRNIPNDNFKDLNRVAFAGGLDFSHRFHNDEYEFSAKLLGSNIQGDKEAILRVQESSAHYFQRPDVDYLGYNPNRTSLSGFAANLFFYKIAGSHWRWGLIGITRSPEFEVNDLGYMRDSNYNAGVVWGSYQENNPGKIFRDYFLNFSTWYVTDYKPQHLFHGLNIHTNFRMLNYWSVFIGLNQEFEGLNPTELRGGPTIIYPANFYTFFGFSTDQRKKIFFDYMGGLGFEDNGSCFIRYMPSITLRPFSRFDLSFSPVYIPEINDHQYVDTIEDEAKDDLYIFAKLKRKTVFLTMRANFTFTPNLSIQFYGMPFISAGRYSNFKQVIEPRANNYDDRYQAYQYEDNPDFNFKQFRANLVIRWEYSLGSTFYFAWSHGRTDFDEEQGQFSLKNDTRELFDADAENVVLVKFNRWLNW